MKLRQYGSLLLICAASALLSCDPWLLSSGGFQLVQSIPTETSLAQPDLSSADAIWVGTSNWSRGYFTATRGIELILRDRALAGKGARIFTTLWQSPYSETVDPARVYVPRKRRRRSSRFAASIGCEKTPSRLSQERLYVE